MLDRRLRILIAEKEYLIAIDAKEIVSSLLPCDVTVTTLHELQRQISESTWDLALIDIAGDPQTNRRNANMVLATGAGLVFLTGHTDLAPGVPGLDEWPVVIKPFTSASVLDAVFRSLSVVGKV